MSLLLTICLWPFTQFSFISVLSSKIGPEVIKKFAKKPLSNSPILSFKFKDFAGIIVNASRATFSDSPFLMAFLMFFKKSFLFLRSDDVIEKLIPFFSNTPKFIGAWFQYLSWLIVNFSFRFVFDTSNAFGKLTGIIKVLLNFFNSLTFSYSLPDPLITKSRSNSFESLAALYTFNLSLASKSLGNFLFSINASRDKSLVSEEPWEYQSES